MAQADVVPSDFIAWYQRVWEPMAGAPDITFVTMARYKNGGSLYILLSNVSELAGGNGGFHYCDRHYTQRRCIFCADS